MWVSRITAYHNNFVGNVHQFYADLNHTYGGANALDNGYPSGGNFWSDYTGPDADDDGIGDVPYIIDSNNTDSYPLMLPYKGHNIAVGNIHVGRTVVAQGTIQKIDVNVTNTGSFPETFNLAAYTNATILQTQTVTVAAANSTAIRFYWDTAGIAYGSYSIEAYATPVFDETNLDDNNFSNGWILVTVPGDLNGDQTINILDAILLANAFGSTLGDSNWNPNADLNGDDVVNILDAIILAAHYGEQWA